MSNFVVLTLIIAFCVLFWSSLIGALVGASVLWGFLWGTDFMESKYAEVDVDPSP